VVSDSEKSTSPRRVIARAKSFALWAVKRPLPSKWIQRTRLRTYGVASAWNAPCQYASNAVAAPPPSAGSV
jgi:hypothetical protein